MPLPFLIAGLAALGSAAAGTAAAVGAGAAAVGAAAAGTAAAVGGAAAAVGTAAAGTAAAVGTAAASTAVGSAAVGAMTAVGTAVGTAAGTVAAATTAVPAVSAAAGTVATIAGGSGAAAVGTIATTGAIGAAAGISGAAKLSEAGEIKDAAMSRYHAEKTRFDKTQGKTNDVLKSLGEDKLKIWQSFDRFTAMFSKIQNPPDITGHAGEDSLNFTAEDLEQIQAVAISAKDLLAGGVGSVAAGSLIGFAATGGLVSTLTASTGTAISALSGAAATNATLAVLGGGSLAVGGAGMAGDVAVFGGLTVAPMLMVGGFMLNGKASKALENAEEISSEADSAVAKMKTAEIELGKVKDLASKIQEELKNLNLCYTSLLSKMEEVVSRKTNYNNFSYEEKRMLEKTILSVKLLKQLSMQNILSPEETDTVLENEVKETLKTVRTKRTQTLYV